jgi:integrase
MPPTATTPPAQLTEQAFSAAEPEHRLRAISTLRAELDDLELDAVRSAVRAGASWSEVAGALGVSKQSAHKRYAKQITAEAPPAPRRRRLPEGRIVVTASARRVVRAARAAARALGHREADTAHLLLGLLADGEGPAARCLNAIDVDFDRVRDAMAGMALPPGAVANGRRVPIAPAAREALEQSLREARRLGHTHLGPEHLLLGLLRDDANTACTALRASAVSPEDLERCLGKVLRDAPFAKE